MAQYTKHNSNYIKIHKHQNLKDGSTIFERDWVTIGSQLHFGSGKTPYYNNGNFIFTRSTIPTYQKKYKNGVTIGTWTYDDVKNAISLVNQINPDEHTEDIRSFVYYGSCVELVRSSVERIINTFPGNITSSDEQLELTTDECNTNTILDGYYILKNPFQIDIKTKNIEITKYDNELRYLTRSYTKYAINGNDINKYEVVNRKMYEKIGPISYETVKDNIVTVNFDGINGNNTLQKEVSLTQGRYYLIIDGVKNTDWITSYRYTDRPDFSISNNKRVVRLICDKSRNIKLLFNDNTELVIVNNVKNSTIAIEFYTERKIPHNHKYYQMFNDEEYNNTFKANGWVESICPPSTWLPNSNFYNACDEYQSCILTSELSGIGYNQPLYTVTINGTDTIEGYLYNGVTVQLVKRNDFVLQPKNEIIDEYFNSLKGFEKQLLNTKSKPLYSNKFVTPIEYNMGYVYYKRTYTWPSNGYCINITSPLYIDFLNSLTDMAQTYDELWTDNIWRRMTHEAIKNYDWAYTRAFEDGEEQDNIDGGERMHKVLNVVGRVFDDIKRYIDLSRHTNRITYNSDRNMTTATISKKLEIMGFDTYSTIPSFKKGDNLSEVSLSENFLNEKNIKWYDAKNCNKITFNDIDVDFMRKLLLSSKKILQTKGTRQSIDMIMGMFGYGEADYSIIEEFYTTRPKAYNTKWSSSNGSLYAETLGDAIVELNMHKNNDLLYDNDASGIPVGSFQIYETENNGQSLKPTTYLIPYYDQSKLYDGDFYFQGKGGWLYDKDKQSGNELNQYGWQETLSYLHVVSNVSGLLDVNPMTVNNGDIYYVVNINDYVDYTEEDMKSRFFILEDEYNPERFSSWKNIDLNVTGGKYKQYAEKAIYLNSIIPYNIGNNPHVGYGKYDNGNEYIEYMKNPFKYSIDTNNFDDNTLNSDANTITFNVSNSIKTSENEKNGILTSNDKIQIFADKTSSIQMKYNAATIEYKEYNMSSTKEKIKNTYYLNSKVIYLKNNINNPYYKSYFKQVIIKYLMQIIPSTAIMILENFD